MVSFKTFTHLTPKMQETFGRFKSSCINTRVPLRDVKTQYVDALDEFIREGKVQEFYDRTKSLSLQAQKNGDITLSSLLISELGKLGLRFNLRDNPENVLLKALYTSKNNNDRMHELARLCDLEILYRESGEKEKLLNTLRNKIDCCKKILYHYKEDSKNFTSISKKPASRDKIKRQLGYAYSSMAKELVEKDHNEAIRLFDKSININRKLGAEYAVQCMQKRINAIIRNAQQRRKMRYNGFF